MVTNLVRVEMLKVEKLLMTEVWETWEVEHLHRWEVVI
jgi:hypothetical protein